MRPASCACGARLGCFGEKAATPNPGRGLRFLASRATNRNSPILTQTPPIKTAAWGAAEMLIGTGTA